MTSNFSKMLAKFATDVSYSQTTNSEYYVIGCLKVRFSDHLSNDMTDCDLAIFNRKLTYIVIPLIGTNKEIQWFRNQKDCINFVLQYSNMARLMLKAPTKSEPSPTISKTYNEWRSLFSTFYECKKINLTSVLNELFKYQDPSIIASIKCISSLTADKKYSALISLLKKVKK